MNPSKVLPVKEIWHNLVSATLSPIQINDVMKTMEKDKYSFFNPLETTLVHKKNKSCSTTYLGKCLYVGITLLINRR